MAIYRGSGGSGSSTQDSYLNEITQQAVNTAVLASTVVDKEALVNPHYDAIDSLYSIQATLESLYTDKVALDSLFADKLTLDSLFADKAILDSLYTDKAALDSLFADKVTLDSLFADKTALDTIYTNIANITNVVTNIADVNAFATTYSTGTVAPTTGLFEGKLFFNTTTGALYAYVSSTWQETTNFVKGFIGIFKYLATAGQTVFTGADSLGEVLLTYAEFATNVYLNGILLDKTDYTITNNNTVTLAIAAVVSDEIVIHGYQAMTLVEAQAAQLAQALAETAQTAAELAETNAETAETNALASSAAATVSAAAALAYKNAADVSETSATATKASMDSRYNVSSTEPSSPATGEMWFDSVAGVMKVYTGSLFVAVGTNIAGIENSAEYTATAGQTTFAVTYDVGFIQVFLNGIMLKDSDFAATNGTSVVLVVGAALDDTVYLQSFGTFELADSYTKALSDARYEPIDANIVKTAELKTVNGASLVGSGDISVEVDVSINAWHIFRTTAVNYTTEDTTLDFNGIVRLGSNLTESGGKITIAVAGMYLVSFTGNRHTSTDNAWDWSLAVNSGEIPATRCYVSGNNAGSYDGQSMTVPVQLAVGDEVYMRGKGYCYGTTTNSMTYFTGVRLGL